MCCVAILVTVAAYLDLPKENVTSPNLTIEDWSLDETFFVEEIEEIPETGLRAVIVRRERDNELFQMITTKNLSVGTMVEISEIKYKHHQHLKKNFFIVK